VGEWTAEGEAAKETARKAQSEAVTARLHAGLGGTTFRIDVSATGVADVTCTNPAGNVAPGQSFSFEGAGSTGDQLTPRNGQFRFSVETVSPTAPPGSCPNPMWTATVTDVHFTDATLTLFEDSTVSDTITVPVS
jgi:hypothetical protein